MSARLRDLRELGPEALETRQHELEEEIIRLRLRRATGQLSNPMAGRTARRALARVKTLLRQRWGEERGS